MGDFTWTHTSVETSQNIRSWYRKNSKMKQSPTNTPGRRTVSLSHPTGFLLHFWQRSFFSYEAPSLTAYILNFRHFLGWNSKTTTSPPQNCWKLLCWLKPRYRQNWRRGHIFRIIAYCKLSLMSRLSGWICWDLSATTHRWRKWRERDSQSAQTFLFSASCWK